MLGLFIFGTLLLHWLIGLKNHFCLAFLLLASFLPALCAAQRAAACYRAAAAVSS